MDFDQDDETYRDSYSYSTGLGVIFDSDGVLVDSEPISFESIRRAYAEVGVGLDERDLRDTIGRTLEATVMVIWERYGYRMSADEFWSRKQRHYEKLVQDNGLAVFPGVLELLDDLDEQEIPYAIASSARPETIELNLLAAGLEERFSTVISSVDIRQGKPDPEIFLLAARRLGLPPEHCVVIEDSSAGVEAAWRAGMPCIAVTNTFPARLLSDATCVVRSLEEVNVALLRKTVDAFAGRPKTK